MNVDTKEQKGAVKSSKEIQSSVLVIFIVLGLKNWD